MFKTLVLFTTLVIGANCFVTNYNSSSRAGFCTINVSQNIGQPSPLIVYPGTVNSVRAIDGRGTLSFDQHESVLIACPGNGNFVRIKGSGVQEIIASCHAGTRFLVDNVEHDFRELNCQSWPAHVNEARGTCLWGQTLVKTGFHISTGFVDLYDACHDTNLHHTYYTKLVLGKDANGAQTGVARPDWTQGSFFAGLNVDNLYRRATQRITFTSLLGSAALAERYIHMTNDYFLSKGHMVAKSDFLHGAHHMATFYYTNAAPQWQTFNGNNWNSLENDARAFAARIETDLEVYTGVYGRATLFDVNNNEVELALTLNGQMPAPRIFWKILYDPNTLAGIAFIGLNNPYQSADSIAADVRCRDICSEYTWLTWRQKDIERGYSYCCEVNEFRAAFPDIPSFPVTSILR